MSRDALWKMFFQGDYQQQKPTVLPKVGESRIARSFLTVLNASRPVTFELLYYDHLFSDDKKVFHIPFRQYTRTRTSIPLLQILYQL